MDLEYKAEVRARALELAIRNACLPGNVSAPSIDKAIEDAGRIEKFINGEDTK